eukprot:gene54570-60413_t
MQKKRPDAFKKEKEWRNEYYKKQFQDELERALATEGPNVEAFVRIQAEAPVWNKMLPGLEKGTCAIKLPSDSLTRLLPGVAITGATAIALPSSTRDSKQKIAGKELCVRTLQISTR